RVDLVESDAVVRVPVDDVIDDRGTLDPVAVDAVLAVVVDHVAGDQGVTDQVRVAVDVDPDEVVVVDRVPPDHDAVAVRDVDPVGRVGVAGVDDYRAGGRGGVGRERDRGGGRAGAREVPPEDEPGVTARPHDHRVPSLHQVRRVLDRPEGGRRTAVRTVVA